MKEAYASYNLYMPKGVYERKTAPWNKGKIGWRTSGSFTSTTFSSDFLSTRMKGENNPNWKNGSAEKLNLARKTREYRAWRVSVFKRDGFSCVLCGYKSKGTRPSDIHSDHIKPFADHPELRFAIDNGRTLCVPCHKKTDTWGFRKK